MKRRLVPVLTIIGIAVLSFPSVRASTADPKSMIVHADSVILNPASPRDALKGALQEMLDAALLVLPRTESDAECRSRIETAKAEMDIKDMFSDKVRQYLGFAHRLLANGERWEIPAEMRSPYRNDDIMAAAKQVGRKLVDSALAAVEGGRGEEAARCLVDYVLMVITPVEAVG